MANRRFEIDGIENVRLLFSYTLDCITIIVEEKSNLVWNSVVKQEHYVTVENFDFEKLIIGALKEYSSKKIIEEHISNEIPEDNVIVIPELEKLL